jgi:hypothetical protein
MDSLENQQDCIQMISEKISTGEKRFCDFIMSDGNIL